MRYAIRGRRSVDLFTAISRKVVLQTGKAYATMSKVIMGNGGFYSCLSEPQCVSAWWKETAQTHVFVLSFSLLLNRLEHQSSKAKLVLPIMPIAIVAYAFTLSRDNLCRNSCILGLAWIFFGVWLLRKQDSPAWWEAFFLICSVVFLSICNMWRRFVKKMCLRARGNKGFGNLLNVTFVQKRIWFSTRTLHQLSISDQDIYCRYLMGK